MSNPHPKPQVKTNRDAMSAWMKAKYSTYVPRQREKNEAPSSGVNMLLQPVYVPEGMRAMRPGADEHQRYRSLNK